MYTYYIPNVLMRYYFIIRVPTITQNIMFKFIFMFDDTYKSIRMYTWFENHALFMQFYVRVCKQIQFARLPLSFLLHVLISYICEIKSYCSDTVCIDTYIYLYTTVPWNIRFNNNVNMITLCLYYNFNCFRKSFKYKIVHNTYSYTLVLLE